MKSLLLSFAFAAIAVAQAPAPDQSATPVFRATSVSKSIKAINYRHRSGSTEVGFEGTALMPKARGTAKVDSRQGAISVDATFKDIGPASQFGAEYLTYVLWAISPEGRPKNLGEVLVSGGKSALKVTSDLQVFGMIVTAEPYFAVSQPSDVIVMQNEVRADTMGQIETVDAKYELLQRGQYEKLSNALQLTPDPKIPVEIYEARNAVQIAQAEGADKYAAETFQKAKASLAQAESYLQRKQRKPAIMIARATAQTAEDARTIAVKREQEEMLAQEREAAAAREAEAKRHADAEQSARQQADAQRQTAEAQKLQADAQRAQADAQRAQAEAASAAADKQRLEAQLAATQAEAEKAKAQAAQQESDAAAQRAQQQAEQSEREKLQLRAQLLAQLNAVLETRDTDRGLVVTMADVLFDTGKYTLKQGTRETLARLAGIILAHPGLRLAAEGHTDSTGTASLNQRLSEKRALAVTDFLRGQGIPGDNLSALGLGEDHPVASNNTAAGRQQNRRVELIVSGESIGTRIGGAPAAAPNP